jgi:hypothetical protein
MEGIVQANFPEAQVTCILHKLLCRYAYLGYTVNTIGQARLIGNLVKIGAGTPKIVFQVGKVNVIAAFFPVY